MANKRIYPKTNNKHQRAVEIFGTGDQWGVWDLGGRGIFVDVINLRTGAVYRMGDAALNSALLHYGDTINVEFHAHANNQGE